MNKKWSTKPKATRGKKKQSHPPARYPLEERRRASRKKKKFLRH